MYGFSRRSLINLSTCDDRLQQIAEEAIAISPIDFTVLCGHRTKKQQLIAYEEGKSKVQWPDSKHNNSPSLALDLAPYPIDWNDRERFFLLAGCILTVANKLNIPLKWGGQWGWDLPHFELDKIETTFCGRCGAWLVEGYPCPECGKKF